MLGGQLSMEVEAEGYEAPRIRPLSEEPASLTGGATGKTRRFKESDRVLIRRIRGMVRDIIGR